MEWAFREMSRGEIFNDPYQREFFTQEGLADALIRESIQNSLDAKLQNGPVRVRFHLSGDGGALKYSQWSRYLSELLPHLKASDLRVPARDENMPFLSIEDFGTRGLCGSVDQDSDDAVTGSAYRDFFYFWRNIGRSNKQETERGRWGIGKTVFPASSRLNSFFGLTTRSEDGKSLLMGQSVLKIHALGRQRYCPYGFWAMHDRDQFQKPSDDSTLLEEFKRDFRLTRREEPGVSIVVPFPDFGDEDAAGQIKITPEQMIRSAILHYFYPIIKDELIVEVSGDGVTTKAISSTTIDSIADSMRWDGTRQTAEQLKRLFALVRTSLSISEQDLLRIPEPPNVRAPEWSGVRVGEAAQASIKQQFMEKNLLAIRVPLVIRPKGAEVQSTYFDLFVERDETLTRADDHYIRQGITISEIDALRERGFRGLVVVNDKPLSTLLGDSENPAHTQWQERATKLKERYDWGPYTVRFVRNALQRIIAQLLFVPEGRDNQLLKDIFFLKDPKPDGRRPAGGKKKTKGTDDPEPPTPPTPPPSRSPFAIQQIAGGFRIKRGAGEPVREMRFEVAYEVRRGDAFSKYDKYDFQIQSLTIDAVGASVDANENWLIVRPSQPEFLVEVKGFDVHRDLVVKGAPVKEGTADVASV